MIKNILFVLIGGGSGAVLRYLASELTSKYFQKNFPLATLLVNLAGCFVMGILMGLFLKNNVTNADAKLLLVTGFCGGFTTFSAFAYENLRLIQANNWSVAIIYTLISICAGLVFVWLGLLLTK